MHGCPLHFSLSWLPSDCLYLSSVAACYRNGSVYMCGHLHTLSGLVPNMYSMHKAGTLELELGDWKDGRM